MRVMLSKHTYTHKGTVALKQQISVTPKTSGLSQVWNFFNPSFPGFSIVGLRQRRQYTYYYCMDIIVLCIILYSSQSSSTHVMHTTHTCILLVLQVSRGGSVKSLEVSILQQSSTAPFLVMMTFHYRGWGWDAHCIDEFPLMRTIADCIKCSEGAESETTTIFFLLMYDIIARMRHIIGITSASSMHTLVLLLLVVLVGFSFLRLNTSRSRFRQETLG